MANSHKEQQLKKQNQSKDLKKMRDTMALTGNIDPINSPFTNSGVGGINGISTNHNPLLAHINNMNHHSKNSSLYNNLSLPKIIAGAINQNGHKKSGKSGKHNHGSHKLSKFWSFDYSKKPLLTALMITEREEKIPEIK